MQSLHSIVACLAMSGLGQTELLDFTAPWCGPCRQMAPVVDELAAQGHPVRKVDFDQNRDLAKQYGVTAIPCFVMLVDGKEVDRAVGGVPRERLEQMLRLGAGQTAAAPPAPGRRQNRPATFADEPAVVRGQSPDASQPPPVAIPPQFPVSNAPSGGAMPAMASSQPLVTGAADQNPHRQALVNAGDSLAQHSQIAARCLASSVRLKVEDPGGNSVGSGTIVDAREGEALILTCGHIFRDSKGQGKILVDLFGPNAPKGVQGQLVGYDLKSDVGLVSFRPGVPVAAARLAHDRYVVRAGDSVLNVGCDNGREPTVLSSRVTNTNKYQGPPNIQVAGQPVEGRSGGGLFTAEGVVIGVCNAADPADNEGLFAGVGSIHTELAKLGLTTMIVTAGADGAANFPGMAQAMPAADHRGAAPRVVPTSVEGPRGTLAGQMADAVVPAAQAAIGLLGAAADSAEVICIVRQNGNPQAQSQIFVLDRASPELPATTGARRPGQKQAPDVARFETERAKVARCTDDGR